MKTVKHIAKYALASIIIGLVCGLFGCIYNLIQDFVVSVRNSYSTNLFLVLMPIGGLLIVLVTKILKTENSGTDDVITAMRDPDKKTGAAFCASAFLSLSLTNLFESAMGREAAAFQTTAPVAEFIRSKFFKDTDPCIIASAAVAAGFASIWGLPGFGAVFAAEMAFGVLQWKALLAGVLASSTANFIQPILFKNVTAYPTLELGEFDAMLLLKIIILACACGMFARVHCYMLDFAGMCAGKIKNLYVRIFALGALAALVCFLSGNTDYLCGFNGIVNDALSGKLLTESRIYFAFAAKLVIFAIVLKAGYKVGRLSQTLAVGALFGALIGGVALGMQPGICASLGIVCLLSAAYNTPAAALVLLVEAFPCESKILLIFYGFVAVAISRIVSGKCQIYPAQKLR